MTTPTDRFLANAEQFTAVVDATRDWTAQSPCEDWNAADVVEHVIGSHRDFLEKQGRPLPESPDEPAAAWHTHVDGVRAALADRDFASTEFDGYFGTATPEDMLADFYGFDMTVHRWDLGRAGGDDVRFSDAELDAIEAQLDALGDQLYTQGACAAALEPPEDADRQTRLLARMGRRG